MALQEIRKTIRTVRVTLWIVLCSSFSAKKTLGIGFVFVFVVDTCVRAKKLYFIDLVSKLIFAVGGRDCSTPFIQDALTAMIPNKSYDVKCSQAGA